MEKITLLLEPGLDRTLKRIAAAETRTYSALVRDAVAEYLRRRTSRMLPLSVGAFGSGRGDLSERSEELLERLGEPRPRRVGRDHR